MEPREYFKEVANNLAGVKMPEPLPKIEDIIDYLWNLWERNISTDIAAEMVLQKFGYTKEEHPN